MDHFGGLDVSVKETSICIVDDTGSIVKEVKVASEPQALLKVLGNPAYRFKRIGLEAGPLSQWLFSALAEAELPVICVETRRSSLWHVGWPSSCTAYGLTAAARPCSSMFAAWALRASSQSRPTRRTAAGRRRRGSSRRTRRAMR